jgi:nuclear-control-of-ATPase protein 2
MVTDYKLQYLIHDSTATVDFNPILREYEQNLKAPIKSAVFGNLVTLMLIQVQKAKVDLGTAMLSLDKLMRANELNFEMLAVIPVMVFLAYGWSKGKELWLRLSSRSRKHLIDDYNWTMHDLDVNLMNENPKNNEHSGMRIFHSFRLACVWHELKFPSKLTRAFQEDLKFLIEPLVPTEKRLVTLNRMRMFYKL